ncbi:MAG: HAD family hydrolase [Sedimentisphaerales bacterium]|nr:HAD family hydrolase [Sedimentisphaerales bacterium]
MNHKAVFFDLDGTLVDTLDDLTNSMNFALSLLGQPAISREQCRAMVGQGNALFAYKALPENAKHLQTQLISEMRKRYLTTCFEETTIYPGVLEFVDQCRQKGLKLAVISNKEHSLTHQIVQHYFGPERFECILGQKDGLKLKPDPAPVYWVMNELGISNPKDVLYIGDSDVDAHTALNAKVDFIGVSWGFRSVEQLKEAGAEIILHQAADILEIL